MNTSPSEPGDQRAAQQMPAPNASAPPWSDSSDAAALARAIVFFESLSPANLGQIDQVYAPQARFKDPFNEVQGPTAISAIFAHMFSVLEGPRFVVHDRLIKNGQAFVTWDFVFAYRRGAPAGLQTVRGASHLQFDAQGRITMHRDYWDAAEELYEKLPLLGLLMRWLRRRLATPEI